MGLEADAVAELQLKYPEGQYCDMGTWAVFLAPPDVPTLKRYLHATHDPTQRPEAQHEVFKKMAVACWTRADGACDVAKLLTFKFMAPIGVRVAIEQITGVEADNRGKG